jgi:hypothetical protein
VRNKGMASSAGTDKAMCEGGISAQFELEFRY